MKRYIKIFSLVLAVIILLCGMTIYSFAESGNKKGTSYPYVFVHGMMGWGDYDGINKLVPYWGTFNGDMLSELRANGIECYAASVGKISSYWDRACELYAQLTGTVVDYGEAHSEEHHHLRYGRSYEGNALMDGFGKTDENGELIKINLIGHSMGGPTIRLFTWLLENGSKQERDTSGENVSEFFKGGKGNYVYSVITMSSPNNGTPCANVLYDKLPTAALLSLFGNILGVSPFHSVWDFQLEQYGLTAVPSQKIKARLSLKGIKKLVKYDDNCGYDLSIRGAAALNNMIDTVDGVYYFSFMGKKVKENKDGTYCPPIDMFPLFYPTSYQLGHLDGDVYDSVSLSKEWRLNDGIVPVISGIAPFDEKYVYYENVKESNIQTGIWHIMPLMDNFSHVSYMGMDTKDFKHVYEQAISIVNAL